MKRLPDFNMRLGDHGRLPDGTIGVVVRAKSGTSPARWLAHQETARRNAELIEQAKHSARPGDDADTVKIRVNVLLDNELHRYIRSMHT